jgi:hypothetical protein
MIVPVFCSAFCVTFNRVVVAALLLALVIVPWLKILPKPPLMKSSVPLIVVFKFNWPLDEFVKLITPELLFTNSVRLPPVQFTLPLLTQCL